MKIVTPKEMARIEGLAYAAGSSEVDFMEAAGKGIAERVQVFVEAHQRSKEVLLLCGHGNNAGDAYVAGHYLLAVGYQVKAVLGKPIEQSRPLCRQNHDRFLENGGQVFPYEPGTPMPVPEHGVILDGLFGTGFYGSLREPFASLVHAANSSHVPIIAIDIPSGLDGESGLAGGPVIKASETIYLGLPKNGFFLGEGWNHVGQLSYVDFGLPDRFIEQATSTLWLPTPAQLCGLLPEISRDRHKYQTGLVVGLAGSPGMPGAAILSICAALRGGAGIVRLLHPDGMQAEMSSCPPEIIRLPYSVQNVSAVVEALNAASASYVGPGMGRSPIAQVLMELVLPQINKPCVIDADALYLLSHTHVELPERTVLTPHRGEMARLLHMEGYPRVTLDFLKCCQEYAESRHVTLVLKGGPGFIFHPRVPIFVNVFGDPGMATAGSGDVLTGLIAALLAQGLSTQAAALLGVYLHAKAGEWAAKQKTSHCIIASDIMAGFPAAYAAAMGISIATTNTTRG